MPCCKKAIFPHSSVLRTRSALHGRSFPKSPVTEPTISLKSEVSQWRRGSAKTKSLSSLSARWRTAPSVARWAYRSSRCSRRMGTRSRVPRPALQLKKDAGATPPGPGHDGRSKPFHRRPRVVAFAPCQLPWLVIAAHDGFVSISNRQKAVAGSHWKECVMHSPQTLVRLHIGRHPTFTTQPYVWRGPPAQLDSTPSSPF